MSRVLFRVAVGLLAAGVLAPGMSAQIPDRFTNLQFFPEDFPRDSLIERMRGFSFALGVRCQYCHVGGDGISFEGVEFDRDDDPHKRKARFMLQMVRDLNARVRTEMPDLAGEPVPITCKTCHRGIARPFLLTQDLERVLDSAGIEAAVARYRLLRERAGLAGRYDFGEWEMNTLAERLGGAGRYREAIAIYELNGEFHPASASIPGSLGALYEAVGDTAAAVRSYERVLERQPRNRRALERLAVLRGGR